MKLHIWIALATLSASTYADNSTPFTVHDFYSLEVSQEELALKSIARIILSTKKANGKQYEENIANRIMKYKDNLPKISSNAYTPISIDFNITSEVLSEQILNRYSEIIEKGDKQFHLNDDKLQKLRWKIRYILLVKNLHTLTESYYKLKETGNNIKSCDEIDEDGIHVCTSLFNNSTIVYSVMARKAKLVYQTQYTVSRINHEWVMTSMLLDPNMLTDEFFLGLAYLK